MLKPAILYKKEIEQNILNLAYSDEMFLFTGTLKYIIPDFEDNNGSLYQYAILDKDKIIGYFTYYIDWYTSSVSNFGLIAFEKGNSNIGINIYREIKRIINEYHIHRIEWRMVGNNPVEKHYNKFCKKYNGNKYILKDALRDKQGLYHDDVIYEIVFNN